MRNADCSTGEVVDLGGSYTTSAKYKRITKVIKPYTKCPVEVFAVDPEANEETLLGEWDASDTSPDFRRYKLPKHICVGSTICVVCRREYIAPHHPTDLLIPGNLSAIRYGLMALRYEDAGEADEADKYWSRALQSLNGQLKVHHAGNRNIRLPGFRSFKPFGTPNVFH